jgi:hypothetical protein
MFNHKFNDYWAVTMFSFTNEILDGRTSALDLIDQVLSRGITKRIEVDGPMHFRNFPNPPASEIAALKALLAKHEAEISLIGGAADRAVSATRLVDSATVVASVKEQLALAADLGAFGLRLMVGGLTLDELKELAPVAEAHNVKILFELHGVMSSESKVARDCLQLVKDVGSSHVRLMFDSSLFMKEMPQVLKTALGKVGVSNVDELAEKWASSSLDEFRGWLMPQIETFSPRFKSMLPTLFSRIGHAKPSEYDDYIDYIESVHIKYWDIHEDQTQTRELLEYLYQHNYDGYLTSEWGGHEWDSLKDNSAFTQTEAHKELVERSFNLAH